MIEYVEDVANSLSMLRRNCLALPLELAMTSQDEGKTSEVMVLPLRNVDTMYMQSFPDRVIVVLATKFEDPSDVVLGKVFLQEFYDIRKQSHMQYAPAVLFGKDPPNEMKASIPSDTSLNYITFGDLLFRQLSSYLVLFPVHFAGAKRQKCISMILSFRDYFHYHIKCCKAFLHNRMRGKVAEFLKMLNRAKPPSLLGQRTHNNL